MYMPLSINDGFIGFFLEGLGINIHDVHAYATM